jgi:hypothetical protein
MSMVSDVVAWPFSDPARKDKKPIKSAFFNTDSFAKPTKKNQKRQRASSAAVFVPEQSLFRLYLYHLPTCV